MNTAFLRPTVENVETHEESAKIVYSILNVFNSAIRT